MHDVPLAVTRVTLGDTSSHTWEVDALLVAGLDLLVDGAVHGFARMLADSA